MYGPFHCSLYTESQRMSQDFLNEMNVWVWGEGNWKTGPLEIERDIDLLSHVGWNYDSFLNSVLGHNQGFLSNCSQTHFHKNYTQCMFASTLAFTVQQQRNSWNCYGAVSAQKMLLFCHLFQTAVFYRCYRMMLLQILQPRSLPSSISGMLRSLSCFV